MMASSPSGSCDRRVRDALTKGTALVAEVESVVQVRIAKAQAEIAVQAERIKQVEQQLQAVIDAQEGGTATKLASFIEQMRQTTGVDLLRFLPQEKS
jgi:uncharacterized membrane protein YqiK